MPSRESDRERVTVTELLKAEAEALDIYYEKERAFRETPTRDTAHEYHNALQRFHVLREESRRSNALGDAMFGLSVDRLKDKVEEGQ